MRLGARVLGGGGGEGVNRLRWRGVCGRAAAGARAAALRAEGHMQMCIEGMCADEVDE
jgi:hypothetical protein